MGTSEERSEIVFFDLETTIPFRPGQGYAILEFGAILVCPRKLVELDSYSTLIKPDDLYAVSVVSVRCNGITRDAVASAPAFRDVSDKIFDMLHGRVWAGHNILKFDCVRIWEAFAEIGRPAPHPKGTIDSLTLLTHTFGRRAGNMKLASLATYFGLGQQTHRSLGDVRMNLEVLKNCAAVLFLETNLPNIFLPYSWVPPNAARSCNNGKASLDETNIKNLQVDDKMEETPILESPGTFAPPVSSEGCSGYAGFLAPDEILVPSIRASFVPFYQGQRIQLLHRDVLFQLYCTGLIVRFGVSSKFFDKAGRPRLNIVVDIPPSLCQVLDACDNVSQKLMVDSGSSSGWRPIVNRKNGLYSPTIRLNIPIVTNGDVDIYQTEIYQKEAPGNAQKLVFSRFDPGELDSLFLPGTLVEAYFSLDSYDFRQNAGIRLLAKKLIIHSG
ncbi:protein NEN1-like [Macadamia integrifolia]|uniref:protein NEN1-like n=1 Tax=Macadamia integrifolia TaxID=60698 RepID=UPI001C4F9AF2|nr:protein NEN1-like [Macadamia integrifolia]